MLNLITCYYYENANNKIKSPYLTLIILKILNTFQTYLFNFINHGFLHVNLFII